MNEGNRKRPVYEIHKWWARRLGVNFRILLLSALSSSTTREISLWRSFYSHHDFSKLVVFDPFMGGGTSIVESTKVGARVIGVDVDPIAWFVTKKELDPCDLRLLRNETDNVMRDVRKSLEGYYRTLCPEGHPAESVYFFWVDVAVCGNCGKQFDGHPHYVLARNPEKESKVVFCRECGEVAQTPIDTKSFVCVRCHIQTDLNEGNVVLGKYRCPQCSSCFQVPDLPAAAKPLRKRLFAVEFACSRCSVHSYKKADDVDQETFRLAEEYFMQNRRKLRFPRSRIPTRGRSDPRPTNHGYRVYADLFNKRQLLALSLIYERISKVADQNTKEFLLLAFSDALASNNMFCYYAFDYRKLTPMFGLHAYRPVPRPVEVNILQAAAGRGSFPKSVQKVIRGKKYCYHPFESVVKENSARAKLVYTGERIVTSVTTDFVEWSKNSGRCLLLNKSSESLPEIPGASVDLILTDPPYFDNLPYSEYSDFFYVWLRDQIDPLGFGWRANHVPSIESLYVNPRSKDREQQKLRFAEGLGNVFAECRRTLRPGGLLVFTFHHNSAEAWKSLCKALLQAGFRATAVIPVRSEGKSGFHSHQGSLKWDAVMVCRSRKARDPKRFGSSASGAVHRWARTRAGRWMTRTLPLGMSEADRANLFLAFVTARLTHVAPSEQAIDSAFARIDLSTDQRGKHETGSEGLDLATRESRS